MAGNKETVASAMRKAERFRTDLVKRGVILVPVIWGEGREPQMERKGFGLSSKAAASLPSIGVSNHINTTRIFCPKIAVKWSFLRAYLGVAFNYENHKSLGISLSYLPTSVAISSRPENRMSGMCVCVD